MIAHILGNGPSHRLYEPQDGYIIGCNIQTHPVDLFIAVDIKPFHVYMRNRDIFQNRPIITSQYAMNGMQHKNIEQDLNILQKLPYLEKYFSSGHIATQWALDNGYTKIHLWGFDSIWEDTQATRTDEIIPRDRQQHDLFIHWREKWQRFKEYNIIVHSTKEGTQLKDLL